MARKKMTPATVKDHKAAHERAASEARGAVHRAKKQIPPKKDKDDDGDDESRLRQRR